jgi:MoaA/NifB/PqqE/SkfB family radical SAM enzyme
MNLSMEASEPSPVNRQFNFAWFWLTDKCQLECRHCYAESGPDRDHGTMTYGDWRRVIGEAAELGVTTVQFIGGEPTLHPDLGRHIECASDAGLNVIVFSNLVRVSKPLWQLFQKRSVSLATSYYTDDRDEHKLITGGHDTLRQTEANIRRAIELGIPISTGGVDVLEGQRVEEAKKRLVKLGIPSVGEFDILRGVGRGSCGDKAKVDITQSCGHCTDGKLAIQPNGDVSLCVIMGQLVVGNVLEQSLSEIVNGEEFANTLALFEADFSARTYEHDDSCRPTCVPTTTCVPDYPCNPGPGFHEDVQRADCLPSGSCLPDHHCRPDLSRHNDNCQPSCQPSAPCAPEHACRPNFAASEASKQKVGQPTACNPRPSCYPGCGPHSTPCGPGRTVQSEAASVS